MLKLERPYIEITQILNILTIQSYYIGMTNFRDETFVSCMRILKIMGKLQIIIASFDLRFFSPPKSEGVQSFLKI